ncbi:ribosome maturation factor RimM [Roseovarius nanhaiticus]|uniref:ribosome maturation factor RimM n=1 Tax=Roseovarius nanhaiticus TaxID=573024 RepID=UPI00248F627F|nr:ribosome maturation factor RimM [Roseovarius nanhaiticus]
MSDDIKGAYGDMICIGAIAGSFGVRGEVRLKSFAAVPEDIAAYGPLTLEDGAAHTVTLTGQTKGGFTARLSDIRTKEQADALRGKRLMIARAALPSLPDDEYYHADLVGLSVYDTGGALLGEVRTVLNHGASDLLEIARPGAPETVLLPFTQASVPTVDLAGGRIVADPPEGLFPDA